MDESHPEEPLIHSITPQHIFLSVGMFAALLFSLLFGLIFFTPVGTLLLGKESLDMVENIQKLNTRVMALRDSVDDRDRQLRSIKNVIVRGKDTTFQVNTALVSNAPQEEEQDEPVETTSSALSTERTMSFDMEDSAEVFEVVPEEHGESAEMWGAQSYSFLPVDPPVSGSYSRTFSAEKSHYGLDIATQDGSAVRALADGIVIFAEWTLNYGHVIYVQHQGGWISGFKHCTSLNRKAGDVINARDILGTVGNSGLISSGPHLHIELWQQGVPVDPAKYLIK